MYKYNYLIKNSGNTNDGVLKFTFRVLDFQQNEQK